jgi:kynurenine formamidase
MIEAEQMHNLTLPISAYFPVGSVFPWDSPYYAEDIATIERNRAHLFYISMGSGTGTRLRTPGFGSADGAQVREIDLESLVNREAVVLKIPKDRGEAITEDDIASAVRASGSWERSALIVATGWGDGKRWESLGEAYSDASPHFAPAAAEWLGVEMEERGSDLLLTDCAHLDRPGGEFARKEWLELAPWLRPPWPSDQAKVYLRHYTPEKVKADWSASRALTRNASVVVGLANCGALNGSTARLTILPMSIEGVAEAPCTVVAESGD